MREFHKFHRNYNQKTSLETNSYLSDYNVAFVYFCKILFNLKAQERRDREMVGEERERFHQVTHCPNG